MSLNHHKSFLNLFKIGISSTLVHVIVPLETHLLFKMSVPVENLRTLVLWDIHLQEFFQFVSQLSGPLFGAVLAERWMLKWILHIWECVELQEFRSAGKVLTSCVQVLLEMVKLSSEIFLFLNV